MKLRFWLIILLVVAALALVKFFFFPSPDDKQASSAPKSAGPAALVSVLVVKSQTVGNELFASGTVSASESVTLQPELAGKVTALNFGEGTVVSKGQLLVKINDAELRANLRKLQLQHEVLKQRVSRAESLLAIKGISQEELDLLVAQLNSLQADIDIAEAQVAKAEIRAPFTGRIGLRAISEGAYVTPATVISSLQQVDPVRIDFSVSERYASLVLPGTPLTFSLEGKQETFNAVVIASEPSIDPGTRALQVRARAANPKGQFYPGAFAQVRLKLAAIDSALMIPTEAIVPDLRGQKVFVVNGGKAQPRTVTTGLRTDRMIQVTSGLRAGDSLIVSGLLQVRPDAPVKISSSKK